jgi:ABC-2 type transport system ATP-binding protein
MSPSDSPVLQTFDLTRRFGSRQAVSDLSLTVQKGDVYGFLGRNGAGKTTTVRMMTRLIRPTAGRVEVFGVDVWKDPIEGSKRCGALVEIPSFYPYLSGFDNLLLLAKLAGLDRPAQRCREVLDRVGLADRMHSRVRTYSQGMRQRLGIGQALLNDPDLVMLDEPTNGLDPQGIADVRAMIKRLNREDGVTFFISSHLLSEIELLCNRVAIVEQGILVKEGEVQHLLEQTADGILLTASPPDAVQAVLEELLPDGVSAEQIDGQRWRIPLPVESVDSLVGALKEKGVTLRSVGPEPRTLESVFLALVEGVTADA